MTPDTEALTYDHIVALALSHGFKLKPQSDGRMALNDYVIGFARAVYDIGHAAAKAETADVGDPPSYMLAKLRMVMPLFQEARDALTAITETQRKLHGISPTLADRMDDAGTFSLDDWQAGARAKETSDEAQ